MLQQSPQVKDANTVCQNQVTINAGNIKTDITEKFER